MKLDYMDYGIKKTVRGDWLLLVNFKEEGREYKHDWAPKWEQIDKLYYACYLVESLNGGRNLEGFVENAEKVAKAFEGSRDVGNAEVIAGLLTRIENNRLMIQETVKVRRFTFFDFPAKTEFYEDIVEKAFPTSFPLTEEWAFVNLKRRARCLVINGVITKIELE